MAKRFSRPILDAIDRTKYFYIRAGSGDHRFIGIWVVVVDDRVFIRSWSAKPGGWAAAFLAERRGAIRLGQRELPVRARPVRGEKLQTAIEAGYARKYDTKSNLKFVTGFRTTKRRATTTELLPA